MSFTRHVEVAFAKYVHTEPDAEGDAHIHGGIYVDVSGVIFLVIPWPVLAMIFNLI